ncbi:hypothetical protein HDV03_004223 [Kappamyces sp. JEL0829]|nr:hypothetical protein HDV03_004223 [Kappamyces sp. JEL0829]
MAHHRTVAEEQDRTAAENYRKLSLQAKVAAVPTSGAVRPQFKEQSEMLDILNKRNSLAQAAAAQKPSGSMAGWAVSPKQLADLLRIPRDDPELYKNDAALLERAGLDPTNRAALQALPVLRKLARECR